MIQDSETNFLYLSGLLPDIYSEFYNNLIFILEDCNIPFSLLPLNKDIWAKDFMPVQIEKSEYVQFRFYPDYLKPQKYHHLHTDTNIVCSAMKLMPDKSMVVLDGGNVIRTRDKIILCDKIFIENPQLNESELINELSSLFKTDKIIFIPWDRNDFTGHADGMVRFIDNDTVLINERTNENSVFEKRLRASLKDAGLDIMELPYTPPNDPTFISAKGLHLNYLQMKQAVVVPLFNQGTDDKAVRLFENIFKGQNIATIDCNEIAAEGGVLNCISWNIVT